MCSGCSKTIRFHRSFRFNRQRRFVEKTLSDSHLFRKLRRHDRLGIAYIQMRQVDEDRSHGLVEDDGIRFLHELSNDFTLVVLNDEHLMGWSGSIPQTRC